MARGNSSCPSFLKKACCNQQPVRDMQGAKDVGGGQRLVNHEKIQSASLCKKLPWYYQPFLWTFIAFYVVIAGCYIKYVHESEKTVKYFLILLGINTFAFALVYLCAFWSVWVKSFVLYRSVTDVAQATHVYVEPKELAGNPELCPLQWWDKKEEQENPAFPEMNGAAASSAAVLDDGGNVRFPKGDSPNDLFPEDEYIETKIRYFEYQKRKFTDELSGDYQFSPVNYPDNLFFYQYHRDYSVMADPHGSPCHKEHDCEHTPDYAMAQSTRAVNECKFRFGLNSRAFPNTTFFQLFLHRLLTPIFVFQVLNAIVYALCNFISLFFILLFICIGTQFVMAKGDYESIRALQEADRPSQPVDHRAPPHAAKQPFKVRDNNATPVEPRFDILRWGYQGQARSVLASALMPGDIVFLSTRNGPLSVPCDMVLLQGTSVRVDEVSLTGESTPVAKRALPDIHPEDPGYDDESIPNLDPKNTAHREYVLYEGTTILQIRNHRQHRYDRPLENEAVGYVLRTGFSTDKGELIRSIRFKSSAITSLLDADAKRVYALLFLMALGFVVYFCIDSAKHARFHKDGYRQFLECCFIFATISPMDLPVQAVLTMQGAFTALLTRHDIRCTALQRIPAAGQLDICCLDKTGTITEEHMTFKGCLMDPKNAMHQGQHLPAEHWMKYSPEGLAEQLQRGRHSRMSPLIARMALCQSISEFNEAAKGEAPRFRMDGDSLEKAMLEGLNVNMGFFQYQSMPEHLYCGPPKHQKGVDHNPRLCGMREDVFSFTSENKFMAVVYTLGNHTTDEDEFGLVMKGAADVMKHFFHQVPEGYDQMCFAEQRRGMKVIAMGYVPLRRRPHFHSIQHSVELVTRGDVKLTFGGLLLFESPVKESSRQAISYLQEGAHSVVMITGDAVVAAVAVARSTRIMRKRYTLLIDAKQWGLQEDAGAHTQNAELLDQQSGDHAGFFRVNVRRLAELRVRDLIPVAETAPITYDTFADKDWLNESLIAYVDIAIMGDLPQEAYAAHDRLPFLHCVRVFAQAKPDGKEHIVTHLKHSGFKVLMCGDGTNDLGALMHADVGVAIRAVKEREKVKGVKGVIGSAMSIPIESASAGSAISSGSAPRKASRDASHIAPYKASCCGASKQGACGCCPTLLRRRSQKVSNEQPMNEDSQDDYDHFERKEDAISYDAVLQDGAAAALLLPEAMPQAMMPQAQQELYEKDPLLQAAKGEASLAAPFTTRADLMKLVWLVQEGRATVAGQQQLYRVILLTSFTLGLSTTVLAFTGFFPSEMQTLLFEVPPMLFRGFTTYNYASLRVSRERPNLHLLQPYTLASLLGQMALHGYVLMRLMAMTQGYSSLPSNEEDLGMRDGKFHASVLNTVMLLAIQWQQLALLLTNYIGQPFKEGLRERSASVAVLVIYVITVLLPFSAECFPRWNALLGFVPIPAEIRHDVWRWVAMDVLLSFLIEWGALYVLADFLPQRALRALVLCKENEAEEEEEEEEEEREVNMSPRRRKVSEGGRSVRGYAVMEEDDDGEQS